MRVVLRIHCSTAQARTGAGGMGQRFEDQRLGGTHGKRTREAAHARPPASRECMLVLALPCPWTSGRAHAPSRAKLQLLSIANACVPCRAPVLGADCLARPAAASASGHDR
eukprot:4838900-Pleurochrysis_carterae.AAC.1